MPLKRPVDPKDLAPIRETLDQVALIPSRIRAVGIVFLFGLFLICLGLLKPIAVFFHWAFAPIFTVIGVVLTLLTITYVFDLRLPMKNRVDLSLAFIFGVVFIGTLMVTAFLLPNPTAFQYTVFRVTLSIAAAGIAAVIPGFLNVTWTGWGATIRASGAIAVFVIVYLLNPAKLSM